MRGRADADKAAEQQRRWHTYHLMGVQVGFRNMPKLAAFVAPGGPAAQSRQQTQAEIYSAGLRWHHAINARRARTRTREG